MKRVKLMNSVFGAYLNLDFYHILLQHKNDMSLVIFPSPNKLFVLERADHVFTWLSNNNI